MTSTWLLVGQFAALVPSVAQGNFSETILINFHELPVKSP